MVFKYLDLPHAERIERLAKEATKKEERNYLRSLQPSEVDAERSGYSQDAIDLENEEAKLANIKKEYAARIENIKERMKERLEKIKTGKMEVHGILYGIADFDNKRMLFRDQYGELVDSRDLLPQEMQGNMFVHSVTTGAPNIPLPSANGTVATIDNGSGKKHRDKLATTTNNKNLEHINNDDPMKEHNEEAWAKMNDTDLTTIYGTVDISVIRTMKYNEKLSKWQTPADFEKSKGATPKALQSSVNNDPAAAKKIQQAQQENADKNKGKKANPSKK